MKSALERIQNEWQCFCAHPNFIFMGMWKSNNDYHMEDKKNTDRDVLLKSTMTCPPLNPDVFQSGCSIHTLNLQEFGGSPASTGRWQIHCATALGTLCLTLSGGLLL